VSDYLPNDGRYPEDTAVWTPYPLFTGPAGYGDRDTWPWLHATILGQCGPDEWHLVIEAEELIETESAGTESLPTCFRDSSELLAMTWEDEQR
jgi:hypothetical protein